jgi:glycosyltransferase involved in cell wall biosynthesis
VDAPGRFNPSAARLLRDYIRRHGIQVLHTHFYKTDIIGLLASRGTSCKLVTTPHGWSTRAGLALRAYEALDRIVFRFFDAVVPLSPALHQELRPHAGSGLRYIQNGVDIDEVDAAAAVAPEATAWRQRGELVIGYIGQLISRKGIDTLLRAFAGLPPGSARLVLVGEGPQRAEFETLARQLGVADRVQFLGYREDRLALLRGFDVLALPSLLEGIPRCLMEAMAAGIPIIASDIPGCRDLIDAEATGLLFPPGDVDALRNGMEKLRDAGLRATLSATARNRVVAEFSAAAMARSYSRLYQDLVG